MLFIHKFVIQNLTLILFFRGHNKYGENLSQRTRLPPPGFSHMNAFGIGVPRAQQG